MFDKNSLQLLYASHPVKTKIDGNKVEFIVENKTKLLLIFQINLTEHASLR